MGNIDNRKATFRAAIIYYNRTILKLFVGEVHKYISTEGRGTIIP